MSQRELADIAGLNASYLSQIENAVVKPSLRALVAISSSLKSSIDYLVTGLGSPQKPEGCTPVLPGTNVKNRLGLDLKDEVIFQQKELLASKNSEIKAKDNTLLLQKDLLVSKEKELEAQKEISQLQNEISQIKQRAAGSPFGVYVDYDNGKTWVLSVRLEDEAPDFIAESTQGEISFHEHLGDGWGVLFSHPRDYTPVCTTELGRVALLKDEFEKLNVKVVSLSINSMEEHLGWIKDIEEIENCKVDFPIIADPDKKVAMLYNMICPNSDNTITVRSVFIISPDKKIKLIITYPLSTGRCFNEIIRTVKSLQLSYKHPVGTPADWQPGSDCLILPSVKKEDIPKLFPKGHKEIRPYYRTTPQPAMTG